MTIAPPRASRFPVLAGLAAGLYLAPTAASAQAVFDENIVRDGAFARDRNVSVRERPRPLYASLPYRFGSVLVSPQVAAGVEFNDNVFADSRNEVDDVILRLQPQVAARTDWSRHAVDGFARSTVARFADADSENTVDWAVGGRGRYDISGDTAVQAGASYERLTEPRTASESPDAFLDEPVRYEVGRMFVGAGKNFNRVRVTGQVNYRQFDFENTEDVSGNEIFVDSRDRKIWTAAGRADYALSPAVSVFALAAVNNRDESNQPVGSPDRSSTGYDLLVGSSFDLGGLARGDLGVGIVNQDYDDPTLQDPETYTVRGQVEYFPTQLVTLRLTADRFVEDSVRENSAGFVATTIGLQADYELRRNLILTGGVAYNQDDYEGLDRRNKRWITSASANYLLNRSVGLSLAYQRFDQESSGSQPGREYLINRVIATVIYQFGVN